MLKYAAILVLSLMGVLSPAVSAAQAPAPPAQAITTPPATPRGGAAPDFATEEVDPASLCFDAAELPGFRRTFRQLRPNITVATENPEDFPAMLQRGRVSGVRAAWVSERLIELAPNPGDQAALTAGRQALATEPFLEVSCRATLFRTSDGAQEAYAQVIDIPPMLPPTAMEVTVSRPAVGDAALIRFYRLPTFGGTCVVQGAVRQRNVALTFSLNAASPDGMPACGETAAQAERLLRRLSDGLTTRLQAASQEVVGCIPPTGPAYDLHIRLFLFVAGEAVTIPANTGRTPDCERLVHTHGADNIIHVEPSTPGPLTLGDFFRVWGQRLDTTHLMDEAAGDNQEVAATINGERYSGAPQNIVLNNLDVIVLQIGPPFVEPPAFSWPPGFLPRDP